MREKEWNRPELVIVVRSTPEENVLLECKYNGAGEGIGLSQTSLGHGCQAAQGQCGACQSLGGSGS